MAFWSCGFEAGDKAYYESMGWVFSGATTDITNTVGQVHKSLSTRGGDNGLFIEDDADSPVIGTGGRWIHFWWGNNPMDVTTAMSVIVDQGASVQATVQFYPTGTVLIRRGGTTGAVLAAGSFNPNVNHWVAIEFLCQNSGGQISVYTNGQLRAQVTGADTQQTASPDWDQIRWDGNNIDIAIDDIVVTTAAEGRLTEQFLPAVQVDGNDVLQSGAGSTGGAGDFGNVDELPPSSADFNEVVATTEQDTYTLANLPWSPQNIHAVTVYAQAARDGVITGVQAVIKSDLGGTPTQALDPAAPYGLPAGAGQYEPVLGIFNVDPDTAVSWTEGGFNNSAAGARFT